MHKNRKRMLMLVFVLIFGNSSGYAGNGSDYVVGISEKFGRGILNVLSSPLELPCTIGSDVSERGAAGFVTGLFRGLAFVARRALVGATEAGTFMIPMEATLSPVCAKRAEAKVES